LTKLTCIAFAFGCSRIFESAVITIICSLLVDFRVVVAGIFTVCFEAVFGGFIADFESDFDAEWVSALVFVLSAVLFKFPAVLDGTDLSLFVSLFAAFVLSEFLPESLAVFAAAAVFGVGFDVVFESAFGVVFGTAGDFFAFGVGVAFTGFLVWAIVSSPMKPISEKQRATTEIMIFRFNFFIFYLLLKVEDEPF
jgi:hypothetical protein